MRDVLIVASSRTPVGSLAGQFAAVSAVELGVVTARETLARAGATPDQLDEVIFGNVLQAGQGQNPARQIAVGGDVPVSVPSYTVNKVCGSGMKAVELAWQSIVLDRAALILAGGTESMTQAPYLLPALRAGARMGDTTAIDSMVHDGLMDIFNRYHMGITAENLVDQFSVTREEQDAYALESQRKAGAAMEGGHFMAEIVPVTVKHRKGETVVDTDEHPRPQTTLESLAKLRPAFKKDGSVTAGNASGINDGAASVLVAGADSLPAGINADQAVYLRDVRSHGCAPETMGLGPIQATRTLLDKAGLKVEDIGLWELSEAFAVQSIAVERELGLDTKRVNVNGGAIALGHPIGCSGARLITSLIHEMKRRNERYGVAAMCIGGGQGIACLLENR